MIRSEHITKFIGILILSISLFGCFDTPDEFVSPSWDTELHLPITSKEFQLLEMVILQNRSM